MNDLYGWLRKNLKGKKGQQGFTLIELLVVVTILGVLAGIVTLSLVGLTTNANVQSCRSEYKTVQAAVDAFMADNQIDSIAQQTTATNDMTIPLWQGKALYNGAPSAANQNFNYTRNGTTQFKYTWDSSGKVQVVGPAGCTAT